MNIDALPTVKNPEKPVDEDIDEIRTWLTQNAICIVQDEEIIIAPRPSKESNDPINEYLAEGYSTISIDCVHKAHATLHCTVGVVQPTTFWQNFGELQTDEVITVISGQFYYKENGGTDIQCIEAGQTITISKGTRLEVKAKDEPCAYKCIYQ